MAYLPAALDKLLGIYLLAVLSLRMFRPAPAMQLVMMIVGAVTILAAVLMAMMQHNLKKLLSFHAVSQVGYMVLGIGTGTTIGVIGGLFHMLNNAIYKSNLFLMSGTVSKAAGSDELEEMGGLARLLPVTFVTAAISAAAISGVPPLNGFVSKWLIYQGALQVTNRGLAVTLVVVAVFGSALTLASFVKAIYSAFLSPAPAAARRSRPRESFFLVAPMVVLAGLCVFLGVFPNTVINHVLAGAIPEGVTTGVEIQANAGGVAAQGLGLWSPAQATGLIGIGLVLGGVFAWLARGGKKVRVVRPFLGGEVPAPDDDRFRVPGTHFYETIGRLPIVGRLLSEGESSAFDLYYWSGKHGHTLVEVLRAQHTGLLSLYVAWGLLGLVATMVYLLATMGT
jgi:formate hydrogenlyase subunit 3/multisubunit Na+/H+ antiporter MnhD subunit